MKVWRTLQWLAVALLWLAFVVLMMLTATVDPMAVREPRLGQAIYLSGDRP